MFSNCSMICLPAVHFVSIGISYCATIYSFAVGMDHARIHPKFLHSNATSHKWALGGMLSFGP